MSKVSKFLGHKKGDFISLSTDQTMEDHSELDLEMVIKDVRTYKEPNDTFRYTGYVCSPRGQEDMTYMLIVFQVDDEFELKLYYLNNEGDVEDARELLLSEDGEDLVDEFAIEIEFNTDEGETEEHPVNWTKKSSGTFFGIEVTEEGKTGIATIAEYQTDDPCGGNDHGLVEWKGDCDGDGWIEFWMGTPIEEFEVKFHNL